MQLAHKGNKEKAEVTKKQLMKQVQGPSATPSVANMFKNNSLSSYGLASTCA
jgi:hypothetical protein